MASIIKGQIIKHLSKFAKNLSQDRIRLSTLKGEGNLTDLELDEEALMEVLEFPSWLALDKVLCKKVSVKIPWTKLKSHPICIYLDQVELEMSTCRTLRETTDVLQDLKQSQVPVSRYGFAEKVVDGMYIHISSINGILRSDTFLINLQVAQLVVQSTTPHWKPADLRFTRIKDANREQILTFKEVEWSTVRLTLDAVEADTDHPTTPIRLITNQGKVRVTIKKRESDCGLVASKLQMLLDDILWVLTDSQTKAVILHMRSLMPVIAKAANLSKARAADKGQPAAQTAQSQDDSSLRPHNIKTQKELQSLQYFEKYDVRETSYHIYTRSIDLHLCDEMNQPEHEKFKRRVENGAMQICLHGFSFDYYPFHTASSSREHWEFYDDCMRTADKWTHTLLAHLKQQYKHATEEMAKQAGDQARSKVGAQSANRGDKAPPPRPSTGPNLKSRGQRSESDPAKGRPEVRGHPPAGVAAAAGAPAAHPQQPSRTSSSQPPTAQARGGGGPTPGRPRSSKVKLMSHSMVVRLRDFRCHNVAVGRGAGQHTKTGHHLLQSDKATFFLPADMPSLHVEYTSFYFPDELSFPVPSPVAYVQLNPVQLRLDYTSILWLNQFAFNILQSLPDGDEFSQGSMSEGKDHTDIRFDALMPKIILPAEVAVEGQPDRPPELHVQMSQVTATNCRVGTGSARSDLSRALQSLHAKRLFQGGHAFPGAPGDAGALPGLLWDHAYQPNFVLPAECRPGVPVANGSLPNQSGAGPGAGPAQRLTTHVFRADAADDVWSARVEQIWADFHGVPSSRDRPVPLVDPIPLNLWLCWPKNRPTGRRDGAGGTGGQSSAGTDADPPIIGDSNPLGQTGSHDARRAGGQSNAPTAAGSAEGGPDSRRPGQSGRSDSPRNPLLLPPEDPTRTLDPLLLGNGGGRGASPAPESGSRDGTADMHIMAQTTSKISVIVNHYQMLFLLRLQQSIQSLQQSLQADQVMFASKDRPVPVTSQVVTFEGPDVELTLILPPIPGDEEEEEEEEDVGDSSTGRTSTSLSELGSLGEAGQPQSQATDAGPKQGTREEDGAGSGAGSGVVFEAGTPEGDVPTVEVSSSSPVKGLDPHFAAVGDQAAPPGNQAAPPEAPPKGDAGNLGRGQASEGGAATTATHSRQSSDGSGVVTGAAIAAAPPSRRRKSQEVPGTSHSPSASPVLLRGSPAEPDRPPRSASQSDLARAHHAQFSFSALQQADALSSAKAASLTSLDESVDLDIISLSSDSSEGFPAPARGVDGQSVSSGQGTETESEAGQDIGKGGASAEDAAAEEDYRNNKFKLKKVSVVNFQLGGLDVAVEINGEDLTVKADVKRFDREEKGNADFKDFMSTVAAGERSKKSKLLEKETSGDVSVALLRFQSGPKADILSPGGGERGFLQLEVHDLATTLRTSTVTHLGSFVTDEVMGEAMPMSIRVHNSHIELVDDAPAIYPTHPGPQPTSLGLASLHVHRTFDGVFHIEGANDVAKPCDALTPDLAQSPGPEAATPTATPPASLAGENGRLVARVDRMAAALEALEKERSSLLVTLEHLQEELLTSDRDRDTLRNSVLELSRLLNLPR